MLIELLRQAAAKVPDQAMVISPARTVTYSEALDRAESLAAGVVNRGYDRFACRISDVGDLVSLLCGSSLVGAEACVYPSDIDAARMAAFAAAFGHKVIVTDSPAAVTGSPVDTGDLDNPSLDALAAAGRDVALGPRPESSPVLILTTGTTGQPKGARHDWARLVGAVRPGPEEPGVRWLLTYNVNQFAGIQILIHTLATRATLVVPASRRAPEAVAAIAEYGVTHVSATPTFWRMLTAVVTDPSDLPLRQITLGGEVVPAGLLERLRHLFPTARLSQVYAATEFGSTVSVTDGRPGLPLSVLERGDAHGARLRVVDGELEVLSSQGMLGYHEEADVEGQWVATGDLVEIEGDRILFTGRKTERINVGGAKVHPLQVEEVIDAVPGVVLVAAYGRPNPITGHVMAVDVVAAAGADRTELEKAIRTACAVLPPAARPRLVRFVDDVANPGGKIARIGRGAQESV